MFSYLVFVCWLCSGNGYFTQNFYKYDFPACDLPKYLWAFMTNGKIIVINNETRVGG